MKKGIIWDAHDEIPGGGIELEHMPPRFGWMLIPLFIILGFVIIYYL